MQTINIQCNTQFVKSHMSTNFTRFFAHSSLISSFSSSEYSSIVSKSSSKIVFKWSEMFTPFNRVNISNFSVSCNSLIFIPFKSSDKSNFIVFRPAIVDILLRNHCVQGQNDLENAACDFIQTFQMRLLIKVID